MRSGLVVLIALAACGRPSEEAETKTWPKAAPSGEVPIPQDLSIDVVIDGQAKPPITADVLRTAKPDFADSERKAWRVASLVHGTGTVAAASPNGISVTFPHPSPDGLEPVLFLTRRGEVIVAAVDPKDPFPRFHGQGGRLQRKGDPLPHVNAVSKLEIKRTTP